MREATPESSAQASAVTESLASDFTDDVFLGGKIMVRQPGRGYRAGIDAVLLAAAAPEAACKKVLDVGAGAGAVGLCVAARCRSADITLVERERTLLDFAAANIKANDFASRVRAVAADFVRAPPASLLDVLAPDSFDVVLANPPYHDDGAGTPARDALKAASNAMPADSLDAWVRFMARMAAPDGRAIMIHKTEALPRLLAAFGMRFGALRLLPIYPRAGDASHRVLVSGVKGSRAPLMILPGFILHADGEGFAPEANAILRHGATLDLTQ